MIWSLILNSRPVRWLAGALAALAGLWAYGAAKKREGAVAANSRRDAQDAKDTIATTERVLNETPSADPADDIRRRLRDRAGKP